MTAAKVTVPAGADRAVDAETSVIEPVTCAARGEIAADVDPELLIDVVYGVLWYRLLLDHAPLDEAAGRQLASLVVRAVR